MLTQKCYIQAIQLGENNNIPEFMIMFKCTRSLWKLDDAFLLSHLTITLKKPQTKQTNQQTKNSTAYFPITNYLFLPNLSTLTHYAFFTKVEILRGFMQNLTIHDRLYCDVGRLKEKGGFGFASQIGKFQSLSMLRYCIEIADKYQLYCCKQKTYPTKTVFGSEIQWKIHFNSTVSQNPCWIHSSKVLSHLKSKTSKVIHTFCLLHFRQESLSSLRDYFRSDRTRAESGFKSGICQELKLL